jgi:predicted oxidoreductase
MRTVQLGKSSLTSSRLAYGCARIAGTWKPAEVDAEKTTAGVKAVAAAYEAGYTLFDNADIYCLGACETIFGRALHQISGMRERIRIATKCGIRMADDPKGSPYHYNSSADHIAHSCEQSLKRLGVETIDLYQLHRPDLLMNPSEVASAFEKLKQQGKVLEFGVSNFSPSLLSALQRHCPMPLIVNQVEIHLGRLDCFNDGTIDQCMADGITPLAWSPLGGGYLGDGGKVDRKNPRRQGLVALQELMDEIAEAAGVSRTVLALAWLMKHPSGIIPIVGSTNPQRIRDATNAEKVELSREDWYRLLVAGRMEPIP